MKRFLRLLVVFVVLIGLICCWLLFSQATSFDAKSKYIMIRSNNKNAILEQMKNESIIKNKMAFNLVASVTGTWDKIRTGKYEVKKGSNNLDIARMLKNGKQAEIKLVINKLRLKEDLARLIGKNFESDSAEVMKYISSNDSLKQYGVDTSSLFTMIIPNTYKFYWTATLPRIFRTLLDEKNRFWSAKDRAAKAKALSMRKEEVYTLASIVEEETNDEGDRSKIGSVYLNRLRKNMPLQACPTIKYAMKDFTLTRIYEKYLFNPSPYNTYRKPGLPPGPICTPSPKTIDLILDAPKTDYLYFVAKADFSGYHHFSSTYEEHMLYAKQYQKKLDEYMARKKEKENAK
ncbi:endolytic transglycosylase MltG [Sediminibacterium roseum]|uniref:Endolytic murein transglycosylase n=1 Tax=Sediminibacterium roseum TaxID=1978412 RepID=A0ABW9ZS50_9BACT|nr:endolytic transglycosylase MltG [Sediminibacterium roseum]NCI49931.1 endolytic transglycosylase MltG [Sediminibacterium roseum]